MLVTTQFAEKKSLEFRGGSAALPVDPQGSAEGTVSFSFPVADVHSYWVSYHPAPAERLPWNITVECAAQRGMPFITFFNCAGINRLAAGLIDLYCDLKISARMNQETCSYDVTFFLKGEAPLPAFSFFIDCREECWQQSADAWRKAQTLPDFHFPAGVWDPVFCTWYAVHGAVTEAWCDRAAKEAAGLGFGTFILDDGWCYPDRKRISPATISSWYEKVGDWFFDTEKFPDAAAHVRRVQALGLRYLVWVAPYLIGDHSEMYQRLKAVPGALYGDYLEGYYKLDTRSNTGCKLLLDRLEKLVPQYGLDGLKVDFLDQIYPDQQTPRAESCRKFTAELSRRIRQSRQDALIEFRQSYAVPQMLAYGTQFRAGDCPFDFLLNFRRIAQIRLAVGDGIPVHADPAYWPETELPVNIARHFIAMMAGVPMLSIDLEKLSSEAKEIIAFWINFYRKNAKWLKEAHWEFDYSGGVLGSALASGKEQSLAIVADARRVPELPGAGWILNLSPEEIPFAGAEIFDHAGNSGKGASIPLGGGACITR